MEKELLECPRRNHFKEARSDMLLRKREKRRKKKFPYMEGQGSVESQEVTVFPGGKRKEDGFPEKGGKGIDFYSIKVGEAPGRRRKSRAKLSP